MQTKKTCALIESAAPQRRAAEYKKSSPVWLLNRRFSNVDILLYMSIIIGLGLHLNAID